MCKSIALVFLGIFQKRYQAQAAGLGGVIPTKWFTLITLHLFQVGTVSHIATLEKSGAGKQTEEERYIKVYYVTCMYSLQSILERSCFCLSPDRFLLHVPTSCWLCLHDVRAQTIHTPRAKGERETDKGGGCFIKHNGASSLCEAEKDLLLLLVTEHFITTIRTPVDKAFTSVKWWTPVEKMEKVDASNGPTDESIGRVR